MSKNLKGTLSEITKWFYKDGSSAVITGGYMNTDPSYPTPPHQGVDYRARTPIELVSPVDSIVIATDAVGGSGYGRFIYLYLPNIDETIMFAHLSRILVSVGISRKKEQLLDLRVPLVQVLHPYTSVEQKGVLLI